MTKVTSAAVPATVINRLHRLIDAKAKLTAASALVEAAKQAIERIQARHPDAKLVEELREALHMAQEAHAEVEDGTRQLEQLLQAEVKE